MSIRWSVHLDRDDDGLADGPGEDLSQDVLAIHWRRGMQAPHDSVAQPGQATITLRNPDGRYSPERNALPPGRLLQLRSDDGRRRRLHFTGHVSHVEPAPGSLGARRCILHATDAAAQLAGHHVRLPVLTEVRADEIIARCLDATPLRRSRLRNVWLLARTQHSELGRNTRLAGLTIRRTLQRDPDLLTQVGDTWSTGIPALAAIEELCDATRGRFYIDHEGRACYLNRRHLLRNVTLQARFRDDMQGLDYRWGAGRVSQVEVLLTPRRRGRPDTVLWTLTQPLAIEPGAAGLQTLLLRFRDETGRPCAALELIEPQAGRDWSANSRPDGRGQDLGAQLSVLLRETGISAALLELRNRGAATAWLPAGAQLRGTPLHIGDPLLVAQHSLASENLYGPAALRLDLPALTSPARARSLARFELARRHAPRGVLRRIRFSSGKSVARALARRLFDRIRVEEQQSGHRSDYFIIGEHYELAAGGEQRLAWRLEPAGKPFWSLGRQRLNRDALLAW